MDESRKRQLEYTRKWKLAKRSIRNMENDDNTSIVTQDASNESLNDILGQFDDADLNTADSSSDIESAHDSGDNSTTDSFSYNDTDNFEEFANNVVFSSDPESDGTDEDEVSIAADLAFWVNMFGVMHNAVDALLKILKRHGHTDLPATARTLLKTVKVVQTEVKSGMEYFHFGLKNELVSNLRKYPAAVVNSLDQFEISLNIDGLPLFKSRGTALWPVLVAVHLEPIKVFPVSLSYGHSKPSNLDFIRDTIVELGEILLHGLQFGGRVITVILRCVVCDAPAKALVKATKLYSGYYGCDRCSQKGMWVGRITYPEVEGFVMRTDGAFRRQAQEQHHHGFSIFCDLPIDMVTKFPIDYMHQACLGVMRRLLLIWLRGKKGVKMSSQQSHQISSRLTDLRNSIPSSFARKPRSLVELDRWKATEFRQFLLYTGKIVLNGILRQDLYDHFMTLSTACSILVSSKLVEEHFAYAQKLLEYFVECGRNLYGPEFLVYNVHSMVHIALDAKEYGCLDKCSAFPFENYLHKLKRMVRSGKNPLVQIVKRLKELDIDEENISSKVIKISEKKPDNAYILSTVSCCEVVAITNKIHDEENNRELLCRVYERTEPLFREPCDSRIVGIYSAYTRHTHMQIIPENKLERRAIMIGMDQGTRAVFLAILHEF